MPEVVEKRPERTSVRNFQLFLTFERVQVLCACSRGVPRSLEVVDSLDDDESEDSFSITSNTPATHCPMDEGRRMMVVVLGTPEVGARALRPVGCPVGHGPRAWLDAIS